MSLLSIPVGLGLAFNAPTAAPFGAHHRVTSVRLAAEAPEPITEVRAAEVPTAPPPAPPPPKPKPLIETIYVGGNQLAGDVGFDPLQLAEDSGRLAFYREAEVKHARLAMLAAAGWPLSELFNGQLAKTIGADSLLQSNDRVPSILNGGLQNVNGAYWGFALAVAIFAESKYLDAQLGVGSKYGKRSDDYLPGMVGFDPLGMDSKEMRAAEIWNGRASMIAITIFALEEALTKTGVVDLTPVFFKPLGGLLG